MKTRSRLLRWLSALALLACSSGGETVRDETPWVRIAHPEFPLTFEVPEETSVRPATLFSLARPRSDDRARIDVTLFGVRLLEDRAATVQAVQFGFFWVTDEFQGVDGSSLTELLGAIDDGTRVESFLRGAFYARDQVEIEDLGGEFIDRYPARRMALARTVAASTRDERQVRGEAIVVPMTRRTALALIVRFDERSTDDERGRIFPRVFRSVRFLDSPDAPLQAWLPPRRG